MNELLESLKNFDLPNWMFFIIISLLIFKDQIFEIARKIPFLANAHFAHKAKSAESNSKFEQDKEYKILQDKLEASEDARTQQKVREEQYFKIINDAMHFSQTVLLTKIDSTENVILQELNNLQRSVDRLSRTVNGKSKTQDIILERLEKK